MNRTHFTSLFFVALATLTTSLALAAGNAPTVDTFFDQIATNILSPLLGLASMIAAVYFLFGIARFFVEKDQNEDARLRLKRHLMWGLIGLFIIFSIGGIMELLSNFGGGFK